MILKGWNSLKRTEPRHLLSKKTCMEKAPEGFTHVFIQNTQLKPPLVPFYNSPFCVLRKHTKYFTAGLVSRINNVNIDQIKAAHLIQPASDPTPVNQSSLL